MTFVLFFYLLLYVYYSLQSFANDYKWKYTLPETYRTNIPSYGFNIVTNNLLKKLIISAPTAKYLEENITFNGAVIGCNYGTEECSIISEPLNQMTKRSQIYSKFVLKGYKMAVVEPDYLVLCSPNKPYTYTDYSHCELLNFKSLSVPQIGLMNSNEKNSLVLEAQNFGINIGHFLNGSDMIFIFGQNIVKNYKNRKRTYFYAVTTSSLQYQPIPFPKIPSYSILFNFQPNSNLAFIIPFIDEGNDFYGGFFVYDKYLNIVQIVYNKVGTLGQYFGYSGVHEDFSGDLCNDVVFSAPFYSNLQNEGAVFYFNCKNKLIQEKPLVLTIGQYGANFGISMTPIGSIDNDPYTDLAILSPGYKANNYKIYIYLGGPAGLSENYHQIISLSFKESNFFYPNNILHGFDFDDDGFQDLALSFSLNETVVIVRGVMPTFDLQIETKDNPYIKFSGEKLKCLQDEKMTLCGITDTHDWELCFVVRTFDVHKTVLKIYVTFFSQYLTVNGSLLYSRELNLSKYINQKKICISIPLTYLLTLESSNYFQSALISAQVLHDLSVKCNDNCPEPVSASSTLKFPFYIVCGQYCVPTIKVEAISLLNKTLENGFEVRESIIISITNTGSRPLLRITVNITLNDRIDLESAKFPFSIPKNNIIKNVVYENQNQHFYYQINYNFDPNDKILILCDILHYRKDKFEKTSEIHVYASGLSLYYTARDKTTFITNFINLNSIEVFGHAHPSIHHILPSQNPPVRNDNRFKFLIQIASLGPTRSYKLRGNCFLQGPENIFDIIEFKGFNNTRFVFDHQCMISSRSISFENCSAFRFYVDEIPVGMMEYISFNFAIREGEKNLTANNTFIFLNCTISELSKNKNSNFYLKQIDMFINIVRILPKTEDVPILKLMLSASAAAIMIIILFIILITTKLFRFSPPRMSNKTVSSSLESENTVMI